MKQTIKKISVFMLAVAIVCCCTMFSDGVVAKVSADTNSAPVETQLIDGRVYYIKNQKSGLFLDVCGGRADDGTQLIQYNFHGEASQQFVVKQVSTGTYEIRPYLDSDAKCIDVSGGQNVNNANAIIYRASNSINQHYNIVSTGNGDNAFVIKTKISNGTKCLTVSGASESSGSSIIQYDYYNHGSIDNDHWYFIDALVNYQNSFFIPSNSYENIDFYISDPGKYYTIETVGNLDPRFSLTLPDGQVLEDDDSGADYNAIVGFSSSVAGNARVKVYFYDDADEGTVTIRIRKQQAVFYSYFVETNDLIANVYNASEYARTNYNTLVYLDDKNYEHATLNNDDRGLKRIDSEVFVFSGHGIYDSVNDIYGYAVKFGSNEQNTNIFYLSSLGNMDNVKISLWASCFSSNSNNQTGKSFASKSVEKGAKCSIGFENAVLITSLVSFTNNLFYSLYNGNSVQVAANYAASLLPADDAGRNYEICGDVNTKLTSSNVNVRSMPAVLSANDSSLLTNIQNSDDFELVESGNVKQYYKRINGIKTTAHYTVNYKNNVPISVKQSINADYNKPVRQNVYPYINLQDYLNGETINDVQSNKYYHDFGDGYFTPIEVVNYNQLIEESTNLYSVHKKVICKNLYTGQLFDYQILLDYYSSNE